MQVRVFYCVRFSSMWVSSVDFCPAVSNPHIWDSDTVFWAASFPAQPFLEYFFEFLLAVHYLGHGALDRSPWALLCSSPFLAGAIEYWKRRKSTASGLLLLKKNDHFIVAKFYLYLLRYDSWISKTIGGKVLKFTAVFLDATDFEDVQILHPNQLFCWKKDQLFKPHHILFTLQEALVFLISDLDDSILLCMRRATEGSISGPW